MESQLEEILGHFMDRYRTKYNQRMASKLGLKEFRPGDDELLDDFLELLDEHDVDFTLAFRRLTERVDPDSEDSTVEEFFTFPEDFNAWLERWRDRLDEQERSPTEIAESMEQTNPTVIPRNYHVNDAIEQAVEHGDYDKFHDLADILTRPYEWSVGHEDLLRPPTSDQRVETTFCGT
jgi:uncharacterized protein YdiU (UPF0061 family)